MHALPAHLHNAALLAERRATDERQAELNALTRRITTLCRRAGRILVDVGVYARVDAMLPAAERAWQRETARREAQD